MHAASSLGQCASSLISLIMLLRALLCFLLTFSATALACAQEVLPFLPVSGEPVPGSLPLVAGGQAATIYYDPHDARVIGVVATALGDDVERTTGRKPTVSEGTPVAATTAVFVGTLGQSALINRLVTERGALVIANTPFGRFGQADELARCAAFLLAGASKFVTGTILTVDGGFVAFSRVCV